VSSGAPYINQYSSTDPAGSSGNLYRRGSSLGEGQTSAAVTVATADYQTPRQESSSGYSSHLLAQSPTARARWTYPVTQPQADRSRIYYPDYDRSDGAPVTYQRGERTSGEISEGGSLVEGLHGEVSASAACGRGSGAGPSSCSSSAAAAAAAAGGRGLTLSAVQQMCRERCCPFCSSMFEAEDDVQVRKESMLSFQQWLRSGGGVSCQLNMFFVLRA
jgi:hypothetical protein